MKFQYYWENIARAPCGWEGPRPRGPARTTKPLSLPISIIAKKFRDYNPWQGFHIDVRSEVGRSRSAFVCDFGVTRPASRVAWVIPGLWPFVAQLTKSLVIVFPRKAQKARNGDREWRFVVASISRRLVSRNRRILTQNQGAMHMGVWVYGCVGFWMVAQNPEVQAAAKYQPGYDGLPESGKKLPPCISNSQYGREPGKRRARRSRPTPKSPPNGESTR